MSLIDSQPCRERCPTCQGRCWGRDGHSDRAKCGAKTIPELHQCRQNHVWGTLADMREVLRGNEKETRREVLETVKGCLKCEVKIRRLG